MTRIGLAIVFLGAVLPATQVTQATQATLWGRVFSAQSTPLRRARVVVVDGASSVDPVFTDEQGRFELRAPAQSRYLLHVTKPGFAPADVTVAAETLAESVDVRLERGAVVTGLIIDALGEPMVG